MQGRLWQVCLGAGSPERRLSACLPRRLGPSDSKTKTAGRGSRLLKSHQVAFHSVENLAFSLQEDTGRSAEKVREPSACIACLGLSH